MSCGHPEAAHFCLVFWRWCHWIDDTVDQDKKWDADTVLRVNLEALFAFSENRFFQTHKFGLMPLVVQAFAAYGDSIQWEKRKSRRDRQASDVLKSYYHEVFWHVAFLCGGYDHMRRMTEKYREFDYDV